MKTTELSATGRQCQVMFTNTNKVGYIPLMLPLVQYASHLFCVPDQLHVEVERKPYQHDLTKRHAYVLKYNECLMHVSNIASKDLS